MTTYEVHVGSWLRTEWGQMGSWDEASERLIPYLQHMGFSHVELMPITEHPFGGPGATSRSPSSRRRRGWAPRSLRPLRRPLPRRRHRRDPRLGAGAFPSDEHGLARFDGTALYEHEDPRQGFHIDWNTLIYNVGRSEVRGFLIASPCSGSRPSISTACASMRSPRCSTATTAASRANGCPTISAAARIWKPSASSRSSTRWSAHAAGRRHHRRGIDRLAGRDAAGPSQRAGLPLQMEHGLDARHAALHRARPRPSRLSWRRCHLRPRLCVLGKLRAADLP